MAGKFSKKCDFAKHAAAQGLNYAFPEIVAPEGVLWKTQEWRARRLSCAFSTIPASSRKYLNECRHTKVDKKGDGRWKMAEGNLAGRGETSS